MPIQYSYSDTHDRWVILSTDRIDGVCRPVSVSMGYHSFDITDIACLDGCLPYFRFRCVYAYDGSFYLGIDPVFKGAHLLLSIRQLAAERQQRLALSTISTTISTQKPTTTTSEDIELQRLDRTPVSLHHQQSAATTQNSTTVTPLRLHETVADADVEPACPTPGAFSKRHHSTQSYGIHSYPPTPRRRDEDIELAHANSLDPAVLQDRRQYPSSHLSAQVTSFEPPRFSTTPSSLFDRFRQAWSLDWVRDWEYRY